MDEKHNDIDKWSKSNGDKLTMVRNIQSKKFYKEEAI